MVWGIVAGIAAGAIVGGSVISAKARKKQQQAADKAEERERNAQAQRQADAAFERAELIRKDAGFILDRSEFDVSQVMRSGGRILGQQLAASGAAGVRASGSIAQLTRETRREVELEVASLMWLAETQSALKLDEAGGVQRAANYYDDYNYRAPDRAYGLSMAGSILGGIGTAAGVLASAGAAGAFGGAGGTTAATGTVPYP